MTHLYKIILLAFTALTLAAGAGAQTSLKYRLPYPEPIQSPDPLPVDGLLTDRPYGYYNLSRKDGSFILVIGYFYESASEFVDIKSKHAVIARVKVGGLYGYISTTGHPVTKFVYDDASNFDERGYAMVNLRGKWGIIDHQGIHTVPCMYDTMSEMHDGWYEVSRGDEWGYIHNKGTYASSYSEYEKKKAGLIDAQ